MDCSTPGFLSTVSWSLLKLMSIESVMPFNHLVLCRPLQSFQASGSFPMSWLLESVQFHSVQSLSGVWLFVTPWTAACQASLSFTISQSCSNSCSVNWWCHPTILSSVPFSSCLQSFPASGSFLMSQLFASGGQSIGASVSASVLPILNNFAFLRIGPHT